MASLLNQSRNEKMQHIQSRRLNSENDTRYIATSLQWLLNGFRISSLLIGWYTFLSFLIG